MIKTAISFTLGCLLVVFTIIQFTLFSLVVGDDRFGNRPTHLC
jgi:hypothetical protein